LNDTEMNDTQAVTEIRALLTERETAMRERDARGVVARHAPEIVTFDLAPPLRHAGPELLDPAGLTEWFGGFDGEFRYDITDVTVTAHGDLAYCHSMDRMSAVPKGESARFEMWFRATRCLRRIDGVWLITHEHTSTPFYMDGSMRAAVDLKP
jgi:ketosteroid isomerase-like protein